MAVKDLFYAVITTELILSLVIRHAEIVHNRKLAALAAYRRLEEEALRPLDEYCPVQLRKIVFKGSHEERKVVAGYVNRIEQYCIGVNNDIYDFKTFYDMSHGLLDARIYEAVKPIVEECNCSFYPNTVKVVEKMRLRGASLKVKARHRKKKLVCRIEGRIKKIRSARMWTGFEKEYGFYDDYRR